MPASQNTVLVVDDEPDFRALTCRRLKLAGYDTLEARDGEEAINSLQIETPDIILLDLNMPRVDGYEVLEWLRLHGADQTSVMVVTGESLRDHFLASLTLGAKDYMIKSDGVHDLIKRVDRLRQIRVLEEKTRHKVTDKELRFAPILIVDDQDLSVSLTARRLENEGFTVFKAYNAKEAWDTLEKLPIRLVLLDINMPDMNGYELLQKIMQTEYKESLSVIMTTAVDDADMIIDCIRAGADDYVMKPYNQSELFMRVQSALHYKLAAYRDYKIRRRREELADLGNKIKHPE